MKRIGLITGIVAILLSAVGAEAQEKMAVHKQRALIKSASFRNGATMSQEARQSKLRQAKVRHFTQLAMADGQITASERQRIQKAEASPNIKTAPLRQAR